MWPSTPATLQYSLTMAPSSRSLKRETTARIRASSRAFAATKKRSTTTRLTTWTAASAGWWLVGDGQDDVADLLLSVHIPMGLDHILERIGAVDHYSISTVFDQLLEEDEILLRDCAGREDDLLVLEARSEHAHKVVGSVRGQEPPAWFQRVAAPHK